MVFTQVQIWRGVIMTKEQVMDLIDANYKDEPKLDRKDDDETDTWSLAETLMNRLISIDSKKAKTDPTTSWFVPISPCCADNGTILYGVELISYHRSAFDWKDVKPENKEYVVKIHEARKCVPPMRHCGKELKDESDRCGDYVVCDECLMSTVNGQYPVETILSETTECKTFCFTCMKDRCALHNHIKPTVTVDHFIDKILKKELEELEAPNELVIKNYFRLDDCLSCT